MYLRTYGWNCGLKKIAIWKIPKEILRTSNFTTNCSCLILGQNCQSRQFNHNWRAIFFINQFVNSQILFLNSIYRPDYDELSHFLNPILFINTHGLISWACNRCCSRCCACCCCIDCRAWWCQINNFSICCRCGWLKWGNCWLEFVTISDYLRGY